ncbi:molecular chaperone [Pseudomonas sp. CK-NBRI-02]|uniref:fimbrial biogenesis chaperone n=1 Tax=Pseudomonas sp. CK-NBRI-02 TaxID=2249759 RepID=UPI0009B79DC7|nr:molecular chaperone [Pseudomonas sp. CK-NBRI-02]TYO70650.1 molecular chaperone [Pseudomonas sp. CK-NBRI-02]
MPRLPSYTSKTRSICKLELITYCRITLIGLAINIILNSSALANVTFDGYTRFIYNHKQKQLPITIVNHSNEQALVQIQIEQGDQSNTKPVPMAITKPLLVIPSNAKATTDVLYMGAGLPEDRESYLSLTILEIPKKVEIANSMAIALRHNLKLFFRPQLSSTFKDAIDQLHWTKTSKSSVTIKNSSPYYITLTGISLQNHHRTSCGEAIEHLMISPYSTSEIATDPCEDIEQVAYSYISDTGTPYSVRAPLTEI